MRAVELPDSTAFFSLRRAPETLAAHEKVGRFQRSASGVSVEREREREREREQREQRDVAVAGGTRAGREAPEKKAPHERDPRKQLLRRGRKGLGLASTLASTPDQTDQSLNTTWANGALPMRLD